MQTAAVMIHSALIGSCRCSAIPPMAMPPPSASTTAESLRITPVPPAPFTRASRAQLAQRPPVAGDELIPVAVTPARYDPLAGTPNTIDQLASAGKYPAVEDFIVAALKERRMAAVERDEIERRSGSQSARLRRGVAVQRLPAARECRLEQRTAGRRVGAGGQHVARSLREPLRVLERTQFRRRIEHDVGIAADTDAAAAARERRRRKDAVPETRLGDRAEPGDRATVGDAGELGFRGVRRMHEAPLRPDRLCIEQPLDRPPPAPGQALLDLADLLRDVNVHDSVLAELHDRRELLRRHGTQTVGRHADARPAEWPHDTMAGLEKAGEARDIRHEAPLARPGWCGVEAAVRIEHREQREPDAGHGGSG